MRRLANILRDCEKRGVRLVANAEEKLEVHGPSTPELREELRASRANVLHYLRTGRCHHEIEPENCAVCSGHVKRLIASERGGENGHG